MNRFFSLSLAFMLWTANAFSFDKYLDVNLVTEISQRKEKMHIDINSEGVIPFGRKVFIVNPKVSLFVDGSMDISVATGIRHQTKLGSFGHHFFWDSTSTKDGHFNQVGGSIDFLTDLFDYRINYYHPLTEFQQNGKFLFTPHKWIESEVVFKHPSFHIGVGPKYNIFEKEWGSQLKITLPFQHFNIESFISHDSTHKFSGCLSFCFYLYSTPRTSYSHVPVSHRSRVQYSKQPIYITDTQVNKKKDQEESVVVEKAKKETVKEVTVVKEAPKEVAPSEPVEETNVTHWYDFFLTTK